LGLFDPGGRAEIFLTRKDHWLGVRGSYVCLRKKRRGGVGGKRKRFVTKMLIRLLGEEGEFREVGVRGGGAG